MSSKDMGAVMAAIRCREMVKAQPLYRDDYARLFASEQSFDDLDDIKKTIPYFEELLSVRHKLFIELAETQLLGNTNFQQVISLGAGYCSLVQDLIGLSSLHGFEVDREAVCSKKNALIGNYRPRIISIDLRADFKFEELIPFGFNTALPTLCIMEV